MGALKLSNECKDAMFETSCEEHTSIAPSYMSLCFDECEGSTQACHQDDVHICVNGSLYKYNCDRVCRYDLDIDDGDYSGTCGVTSPNGETSDDGKEVCWCWVQN